MNARPNKMLGLNKIYISGQQNEISIMCFVSLGCIVVIALLSLRKTDSRKSRLIF